ncbi:NADH-dependent dehydrogenase [Azorhizobium oxalatiphilum]|uniref:NADH-dependent dehydrogenase n=1 Tax=Azorhizobium oxalatiphilum TaxID=980631 RepID=A0A917C7L9_9HYPH|nr:Gfo/Idh/MocA family oxidoreductase [Azorhizobium oxalatiphilum]GGF71578.1 NADH-dependent dehydrogenase [Azorhizobium oxalatiphilum]
MSGTRLRVGLIGAGWVTQYHLRGWAALADRVEIVAIADPSETARATRMREFGIPAGFASAQEMLDTCALDAVDIAAPRAAHAEMVRLAAGKGLAILCQKPLAPTLAEARQMVADLPPGIRLMVHENWRFRAYYREAAAWLRAGDIGTPFAARLALVTSGTLPDAQGHLPAVERQPFIRHERRMLVSEILIHHLDTLRMLLGPLEVASCTLARICPDIAGEDTAIIQLNGAHGLSVQVFACLAAHGHPPAAADRLEILGTQGALTLDNGVLSLAGTTQRRADFDLAATYQGSYDATIAHFVARLDEGAPFETSPEDNLETLLVVEDCYRLAGREDMR